MSVAPTSSTIGSFQPSAAQANSKTIRQDFQNLVTAPASGDLAGAKDAFAAMQRLLQGAESNKASQPQGVGNKPQNQLGSGLVAFGKALLSGDLGSAQDSVKSLLGEIQTARSRYQYPAQSGEGAINSVTPSMRASSATGTKSIGTLINTSA